jgi:hypothetical protein
MVCHQCGKTVQQEDRFCTGCGASLEHPEPAGAGTVVPEDTPSEPVVPDVDHSALPPPETSTPLAPPPGISPSPTASPSTITDVPNTEPEAAADEPHQNTELTPVADDDTDTASSADQPEQHTQPMPVITTETNTTADQPEQNTELTPVIDSDDEWSADVPVWAPTGSVPAQAGPDVDATPVGGFTADLPTTEPITEVQVVAASVESEPAIDPSPPFEQAEDTAETTTPTGETTEMPAVMVADAPAPRFRLGAVTMIAVPTGIVTLISMFANIVSIDSDQRLTPSIETPFGFRTGTWIADDLADNLSIAGLLAIMLMIAGGVAAGFRWKWGAGLAGGAGLAVAGIAGITIGLAQFPIDAAHEFIQIPSEQQFTLTITRDLGYWLLVVAAALGVVLFFAAINDAGGDRRGGLNPWIAALGALTTVVAAAGPMLPERQAIFSDNWYLIEGIGEAPAMLVVGRAVQLGLFVIAGVVGFLTVRRWGLGLAIGASLPIIWLAASTLFELTDTPVGPGFRNPGASDMHIHGVTIIGVSALAAMAILAVIAAYDQSVRERR